MREKLIKFDFRTELNQLDLIERFKPTLKIDKDLGFQNKRRQLGHLQKELVDDFWPITHRIKTDKYPYVSTQEQSKKTTNK